MTTIDHQQAARVAVANTMRQIEPNLYQNPANPEIYYGHLADDAIRAAAPHLRAAWAETASDGYHTFAELYEYRMLYNAHAAQGWLSAGIPVVKSWHHSDGEECFGGGWFIVTAQLPTGQVSNHYPAKDWDLFDVPWVDVAPEWDGHTPEQAADRLRNHLKGTRK